MQNEQRNCRTIRLCSMPVYRYTLADFHCSEYVTVRRLFNGGPEYSSTDANTGIGKTFD